MKIRFRVGVLMEYTEYPTWPMFNITKASLGSRSDRGSFRLVRDWLDRPTIMMHDG